MDSQVPGAGGGITAILGFSIEPLEQIAPQISTLQSALVPIQDATKNPMVLAEKIVKHLQNYLSSFMGRDVTTETMVPMGILGQWFDSFQSKLRAGGVGFLDRTD